MMIALRQPRTFAAALLLFTVTFLAASSAIVVVVTAAPNSNNRPIPCVTDNALREPTLVDMSAKIITDSVSRGNVVNNVKATPVVKDASCALSANSVAASFPLASAVQLGAAKGESPLYYDVYDGSVLGFTLPEQLDFLHMPLIMLMSQLRGLLTAVIRGVDAPVVPKATRDLIALLGDEMSRAASFYRLVTDVKVLSSTELNEDGSPSLIRGYDGVVNVVVAPLPDGVKECGDFPDAALVERSSKSPQCNARGQLAFTHLTAFVNSMVAFTRSLFLPMERTSAEATCTVDTTLHTPRETTQCVLVKCLSFGACNKHKPKVVINQRLEVDTTIPVIILLSYLLGKLRPYATTSAALRWLLCTVAGVVVLVTMLTLMVFQTMKDSRLGQVGILAGIAIGGTYAAAQGIMFHALQFLVELIFSNMYASVIFFALCVLSAWLAHHYFGSAMPTIVYTAMLAGQYFLLFAAVARNRELCLVLTWLYIVLYLFLFRFIFVYLLGSWFGFGNWFDPDAPKDSFPASAMQLREHVQPLVANSVGFGMSHERKMHAFEKQGKDYTRQQLERLAEAIRHDPQRYATRVRNPNDLMHWAGVGKD